MMKGSTHKISVIAGLGNPGKKYELTRHNLGFLVVQELAAIHGWTFRDETEFNAKVATGRIDNQKVHLLLPTTYMNESGRAVKRYLDFYKFDPADLLVVSDDVSLPFGDMRLRLSGSAGGHNGLKSIQTHLGTFDYARLRMGIGSDFKLKTMADFVLEIFKPEELQMLAKFVQNGAAFIEQLIKGNVESTTNRSQLQESARINTLENKNESK